MEKNLPLTAVFLEAIAVALGTYVFVRGTSGPVVFIIFSAILVIVLSFLLHKKIPSIAMGYLIALGISYSDLGDRKSSNAIFIIVIFVIIVEIVKSLPDLLASKSNVTTTSSAINSAFAFIGMNIGIIYRVNTCSSIVSDTGWNYLFYMSLPLCPSSIDTLSQSNSVSIILEFLTWPAISGLVFASLSETFRNKLSSPFVSTWFINFLKTAFISGAISFACGMLSFIIPVLGMVVPPNTWATLDRSLKTFTSSEPTLFIWLLVIFILMITSLIFGFAAALRGKQN